MMQSQTVIEPTPFSEYPENELDNSGGSSGNESPPPKCDAGNQGNKRKRPQPLPKISTDELRKRKEDLSEKFKAHARMIVNGTFDDFCDFLDRDAGGILRRKDYGHLTDDDKALLEPMEGPQAARKKKVDLLFTALKAKTTDADSAKATLEQLSIEHAAANQYKPWVYGQHPSLRPKKKAKKQEDA